MLVYTALLFWVLICSKIESCNFIYNGSKVVSGRKLYMLLTFIPLGLVMALRGIGVGTDTYANASYFVSAALSPSLDYIIDDGFWNAGINLISYMIGALSSSMETYIVISSVVITMGMALFIYHSAKSVWIATFLFLTLNIYFISMNASRQFIAIVIAINAFISLYHNFRNIKGWMLFIFAVWIHTSILTFFPALMGIYLTKKCSSYKKLYVLSIIISIVLAMSLMGLATMFASIFPHYAIYTEGSSADNLIENTGGGKIIVEYLMFLVILIVHFINKIKAHKVVQNTLSDVCIPGAIFCAIFGIVFSTNTMMNRVTLPYQCLFLVLIPCVIQLLSSSKKIIFETLMLIGLSGYYYLWMNGNLGDIIPYYMWI